jgi:hypothetical protein
MEILGYLSSFMLAIMVLSVIVQFVYAYALQSLAHKNEMSSLAETLAWLPILNLYPFVVCGGGSFPRFLIGAAAFLAGTIGLGVMAGMMGEDGGVMAIVLPVAGILAALGMFFYFGRIFWRTAERRGLSGFIGLLNFVPIVNLFVYPYIAFHDGFAPVNKVGAGLGFLLIVGPAVAQYQMINMATNAVETQVAEAGESGSMNDLAAIMQQAAAGNGTQIAATPSVANSWQAQAMQISMQLSMLEALDPSDAAQAGEIQSQLAQIKQQFSAIESSLPSDRAKSLRQSLAAADLRLVDVDHANDEQAVEGGRREVAARTAIPAAPSTLGQMPPAPPAAPATDATFDPEHGFPVPSDMSCQPGTEQQGDPNGKLWCQVAGGGLKHGWSTDRHPNGELALAGEYRDGLRHGVWTRWYDDGSLRVQAEFAHGLQDGRLIAWDRSGHVATEIEFEAGEPVHR